jgi:hypothetical protein
MAARGKYCLGYVGSCIETCMLVVDSSISVENCVDKELAMYCHDPLFNLK